MEALEVMVKKYLNCKQMGFPKTECAGCIFDRVLYDGYKSLGCLLNMADQHLSEVRKNLDKLIMDIKRLK
jgi:hypothetical protein